VRTYDLATQERIVRGRMPTLEIINDRFARLFRIGLFNFMRRSPEVTIGAVRVIKYGEFIKHLKTPTNLNITQVKPLRGSALFVMEPGARVPDRRQPVRRRRAVPDRSEGREFTPTEQRIVHRMLEVMLADYQKSWSSVYPLEFEYVRSEMQTKFVNIATPTEIVVVSTFGLELGGGRGEFHICMPYSTLEPIRDLIYSPIPGDHAEPDRRWARMLSRQVQAAEVDLVAQLGASTLRVKDLLNLKVGDVLPLEIPELIRAEVDGVSIMECKYGVLNGQYALRIERMLTADGDRAEAIMLEDSKTPAATPPCGSRAAQGTQAPNRRRSSTSSRPAPRGGRGGQRHRPDPGHPVQLTVELGRTKIPIRHILQLAQGSVVELDGLAGEPMDVLVNGCLIAQGEVVVVNEKFGIRLTDIVTPSERVRKLNR
jgi:flagellar motor switch protein FliM